VLGLWSAWLHRAALLAGLLTGLLSGMVLLYNIPARAADGRIVKAHFGGSSWPLAELGWETSATVYVGVLALAINLLVTVALTLVLRGLRVPAGVDATVPHDYLVDADDPAARHLDDLIEGLRSRTGAHSR
jgi:SSS family solute:Na+ symporter